VVRGFQARVRLLRRGPVEDVDPTHRRPALLGGLRRPELRALRTCRAAYRLSRTTRGGCGAVLGAQTATVPPKIHGHGELLDRLAAMDRKLTIASAPA